MKAVICPKYGSPDVLKIEDIEKPVPELNEVLIKIYATTVNRTDCAALRAKPFFMRLMSGLFKPKEPVLGTEFAGEIESVGENVSDYRPGDRVFGFKDTNLRTHAQYITMREGSEFTTIPASIDYDEAAASCEGAHYAYNFINKVNLTSKSKVLLNGATGAIGSAALQLLKYFGANVTATCNTKNIETIKSLGADRVIDYTKEDFTKDNQKYDFVFDTVGKSTFTKCKPLLKDNGIYISSELGPWAQNIFYSLITPLFKSKKVIFPVPLDCTGSILLVKKLIEAGKFKTLIDKKYQLKDIVEAYKYVETGEKTGNVVITVSH